MVFLTGLRGSVFPHARSLGDQPELEEAAPGVRRRITRAQERLFISRAVVRSAWARRPRNPGSRFLDEPGRPGRLAPAPKAAQTRWGSRTSPAGRRRGSSPTSGRAAELLPAMPVVRAERRGGQTRARDPSLEPGDRVLPTPFGAGHRGRLEVLSPKAVASTSAQGQAAAAQVRACGEALATPVVEQ